MEKYKVLLIDDRKSAFDMLSEVFKEEGFFELVNERPLLDESSCAFLTRETQKQQIVETLKEHDYQIVLFDLTLRSRTEENFSIYKARNLLSVEIYSEMKKWFRENNKKVLFVTSHQEWKESKFKEIGEMVEDTVFLKKTEEKEMYPTCGFIVNGIAKCGEEWKGCNSYHCFNKILRRIVENGK